MLKIFAYKNLDSKEALATSLKSLDIKNYSLIYNEYGKPYLKDNQVYFNISHTKDTVVVAISDKEVGIDIEYKRYKTKVMNKYFNEKEIEFINSAEDKEEAFTIIWVKKEAYVKMIGQGIAYGLKDVDTTALNIKVTKKDDLYMAVCLKENEICK